MLPGDGSGSQKGGINGSEVVVLGVERKHDPEEENVGKTQPTRITNRSPSQQRDDAGNPEQCVQWMLRAHLCAEEGQGRKNGVLVVHLAVVEKFQSGPMIVD